MTKHNKRKAKKRRSSDIPRFLHLNIGTVIFGAIFIYMIISLFLYMTADHIRSYQVVQGPLSKNETYTAFVMREETVVRAAGSGYIHYYTGNASKVSANSVVYGLSDTEDTDRSTAITPDEDILQNVKSSLSLFSSAYDANHFSDIYDFKYELSKSLLSKTGNSDQYGNQTLSRAERDGVVVYQVDGYEDYTLDSLTPELFSQKNTASLNSKEEKVSPGDPVYKLITSENWSIAIPVTAKQTVKLSSYQNIKVKFLKDGETQTGSLAIQNSNGQNYAVITFSTGMIRYAKERFQSVELVTNTANGLKIPNSAITTKDFFTIPAKMLANGGDSNSSGFLRIMKDKDGNILTDDQGQPKTEFVKATIYKTIRNEENEATEYYVDQSSFSSGDILVAENSNTKYEIKETVSLEGVYCINKGYAVFRRIEIIDQNEEFCIIKSQTDYGISQYDYIVEDASTVNEEDIM
ncbi:MAG: HlyD family efflux transporter periplasmic adaptor subunit [Lachnospiraceae bacterium]|nr:HlyD family efflux transporter periplasmic adaptor subunit [Lachnospiraceae bacterium]